MLTAQSFTPSPEELSKLNGYIHSRAEAFAAEGEQPDGVVIQFVFSPFGRDISVSFAGSQFLDLEDL